MEQAINIGVLQGSNLGLLFYTIYVNDIENLERNQRQEEKLREQLPKKNATSFVHEISKSVSIYLVLTNHKVSFVSVNFSQSVSQTKFFKCCDIFGFGK